MNTSMAAELVLAALFLLAISPMARAGDTLELFDSGFSDFEYFVNAGDLGSGTHSYGSELLVGVGLTDFLSGFFKVCGEANRHLSEGTGSFGLGLYATVLDTAHVDIDVGFCVEVGDLGPGEANPAGHSQAAVALHPFLEVNLDSHADMSGFGLFLTIEEILTSRDESYVDGLGEVVEDFEFAPCSCFTLGGYYTVLEGHQLFLSFDLTVHHHRMVDQPATEIGSLALGYNVEVADGFEIISELALDIPQDDEEATASLGIGFVATIGG